MELKDYIKVILKNIHILIIFIIVLVGYVVWDNQKNPFTYQGSLTFTVGNISQNQSDVLNYDHYYNLLSSGSAGEIVAGILGSPTNVEKIYSNANVPITSRDVAGMVKLIKTSKSSVNSNIVNASLSDFTNEENLSKVINSTSKVVLAEFNNLKSARIIPNDFQLIVSEPYIVQIKNNLTLNVIITVIAGIILASAFIFLKDALSQKK